MKETIIEAYDNERSRGDKHLRPFSGGKGKMVDTFVGDEVRVMNVNSPMCHTKAYVDGFTNDRVKVVSKGRIGYYLPNLVFVKRGGRDGSIPVELYRREASSSVPGVISVHEDDDSIDVAGDTVATANSDFVKFLEEVSKASSEVAKSSVEFAVLMERGKRRFRNGWMLSADLEEVKQAAGTELERRLKGFKEFVRGEIKSAYERKGRK